jgi:hypothetical protein
MGIGFVILIANMLITKRQLYGYDIFTGWFYLEILIAGAAAVLAFAERKKKSTARSVIPSAAGVESHVSPTIVSTAKHEHTSDINRKYSTISIAYTSVAALILLVIIGGGIWYYTKGRRVESVPTSIVPVNPQEIPATKVNPNAVDRTGTRGDILSFVKKEDGYHVILTEKQASAVKQFMTVNPRYRLSPNNIIMPGCWGDYDRNGIPDFVLILANADSDASGNKSIPSSIVVAFNGQEDGSYKSHILHSDKSIIKFLETARAKSGLPVPMGSQYIHLESDETVIAKIIYWHKGGYDSFLSD